MWFKKPTGAEKRKNRDGRNTNSEKNRKTIRATAKCKSKPSQSQGRRQEASSSVGQVDATSTGVASESSGTKESKQGATLPSTSSSSIGVASGSSETERPEPTANLSTASSSTGLNLGSAGFHSACLTSQSKAFEQCPNTGQVDTGQLNPENIADLICQQMAWGPYDPEI